LDLGALGLVGLDPLLITTPVVTLDSDGSMKTRDYDSLDTVLESHEQTGIDDCSTELTLRGFPIFRGLVGPIPETKQIARYESPDVFEALTKEWTQQKVKRRRRRKPAEIAEAKAKEAAAAAEAARAKGAPVPAPMGLNNIPTSSPELI